MVDIIFSSLLYRKPLDGLLTPNSRGWTKKSDSYFTCEIIMQVFSIEKL